LLFDPQTSGGLLIALPSAQADSFLRQLPAWRVGAVVDGPAGELIVR
jgi:selenophosphate synthase